MKEEVEYYPNEGQHEYVGGFYERNLQFPYPGELHCLKKRSKVPFNILEQLTYMNLEESWRWRYNKARDLGERCPQRLSDSERHLAQIFDEDCFASVKGNQKHLDRSYGLKNWKPREKHRDYSCGGTALFRKINRYFMNSRSDKNR